MSTSTPLIVFYSSTSGNTARFVEKLDVRSARIPTALDAEPLRVDEPYVLITPTYGGGKGGGDETDSVPKQVIRFLNDEYNRSYIRGVIATGNTNFGEHFGLAGDIVARKCGVPHLYRLELLGTPTDVERVRTGLARWWAKQ